MLNAPQWALALWHRWAQSLLARVSAQLALVALLLLFLDSAGTIEFVYTLTLSQLLMVAACLGGAPFVFEGWRRAPSALRVAASALLFVYLLGAVTGQDAVLPSAQRAGSYRDIVYVSDLALGLAVIGLFMGRWRTERSLRPLVIALFAGAALAALYGLYQALARELGLPLSDVNNAVNPDLVTYGDTAQGSGLLGIERVRATFGEPHFLAAYLSALMPAALAVRSFAKDRWLKGIVLAMVAAIIAALGLTVSAPAWALLGLTCLLTLLVYLIARGLVGGAAVAGAGFAAIGLLFTLAFLSPQTLAPATGRTSTDLELTARFRTEAWSRALDLWSARPVLGYGPGQGSVRLARRAQPDRDRVVLGSTQGLWAASLLDVGILGFSAWALFIGYLLWLSGRAMLTSPSPTMIALFTCAVIAIAGSQITGDRLELRVWAVLALVAAASTAVLTPAAKET